MKLQDAGQQPAGQARVIHQSRGIGIDSDELMLAANVLRRGGVADVPTVTFDTETPKMHAELFNPEHCGAYAVDKKKLYVKATESGELLRLAANVLRRGGVAGTSLDLERLEESEESKEIRESEHEVHAVNQTSSIISLLPVNTPATCPHTASGDTWLPLQLCLRSMGRAHILWGTSCPVPQE